MMDTLIVVVFLSGIILIQCNEKENCVDLKLRQCSDQHKTSSKIYPSNIDDLKHYCRTVEQKEECFRNGLTECITTEKEREVAITRFNESASDHYKHICNLGSTYSKLFVKYGKCLNLSFSEQNNCQNKYKLLNLPKEELLTVAGYSKNNSRAENFQKIRQLCCWWVEYQTCVIRAVVDRCGEHAAILINEEFFKVHTSSATSRFLTYKSCLPQDKTFRYPVCFLDRSVDPKSIGVTIHDKDMTVEDQSRRKDIEETIELTSNMTEFAQMEASKEMNNKSFAINNKMSALLVFIVFFSLLRII